MLRCTACLLTLLVVAPGTFAEERPPFVAPEMTSPREDVQPFEYVDVGPQIPNYASGEKWGTQDKPLTKMQKPLSPEESLKHYVTPKGFHLELFADERDFDGKPIAMNWDERGRLWICETVDYPNELAPPGEGRDRIRICEDTDGDWKADKFTVFAENLSIPTAIAFHHGGAIVQDGTRTLYLKDTDGDDKADIRTVLIKGWALGDTHGGVSNFRYGLDNWFWGMQGYNNSAPEYNLAADGSTTGQSKKATPFRMGFFRFKLDNNDPPKVVDLEFIRSTNNNTWGLGFSEEGLVFGSTANRNPSVYMPIANRYYERVRGWAPQQLGTIADTHKFQPITDKVRQVDQHGGYTAAAGHALYTARRYPRQYWNRAAFVCGPTGHLVGTFVLKPDGADFTSTSPCNLIASDDEWAAPIAAEVGPDGNVWVLDWYNYIVQHNPTPQGFQTGKGNAYKTDLRDKKHGRIYRVVYGDEIEPVSLADATPEELVAALRSNNMLWRLHAQRLLVERGQTDVLDSLSSLTEDESTDEIGLNAGVIHALWTIHALWNLHGVSASLDPKDCDRYLEVDEHFERSVIEAPLRARDHPSAGVRRSAIQTLMTNSLPSSAVDASFGNEDLLAAEEDPHVRLAIFLGIADTGRSSAQLKKAFLDPEVHNDPWLLDAATAAAAAVDLPFLQSVKHNKKELPAKVLQRIEIVAEHFARRRPAAEEVSALVKQLPGGSPTMISHIVTGMANGWPDDYTIELKEGADQQLGKLIADSPVKRKAQLARLGLRWNSRSSEAGKIGADLLVAAIDDRRPIEERIAAARQLVEFKPTDDKSIKTLLDQATPQAPPELAAGLVRACGASRAEGVGELIVARLAHWTPAIKAEAINVLLSRVDLTKALLSGARDRKLSLAELTLDQKQSLANHPDEEIAAMAKKLLESGGGLPNADRQKVLKELMPLTEQAGDAAVGSEVFKKQCAKCHTHSGEGTQIGPDLTGMAVHPKKELLGHIIDPSASVEGNYRTYTIITAEGRVLSGMLAGESKTTVELVDAEAKRHTILREDIDELIASPKSLMPEGFEKQMSKTEMVNLLEFLTSRGKYVPLDLSKSATVVSTKGMFYSEDAQAERLIFDDWGPKEFDGVPFQLVDPQGQRVPNAILLHSPNGNIPPKMPKSVSLRCNAPARAIHLLSGVSGWGYPASKEKSVSMIVRLHYADGKTEDHPLKNGAHFADYIRRIDVPQSQLAYMLGNQQLRYLAVRPQRSEKIERIDLIKGRDRTAPLVMAITIEFPQP